MTLPSLSLSRSWVLVTALACAFLVWINVVRVRHLDYVAKAAGTTFAMEPASPTGYAGGVRQFLGAGRGTESYQWIAQTQQMFARGEWRVRHVDYDNVPAGRTVVSSSLYRWWLAALAKIDQLVSSRPIGVAVEHVAVYSDPVLQLLLLVGTATFVARRFGGLAAALISLGVAGFFPFAASFVPGQPQDVGLQLAAALWAVLPLYVVMSETLSEKAARRSFAIAGVVGGLGLWLSVGSTLPILVGIAVGGLGAAVAARRAGASTPWPWRAWAIGGAAASLASYLIEFMPPQDFALRLDVVNPLHALAWLGFGELLARADRWLRNGKHPLSRRDKVMIGLAAIAAAIPVVLAVRARHELFAADPIWLRLTAFIDSAIAPNLWALLAREGFSAMILATLLPLVLVVPAVWFVARCADSRVRSSLILTLGPVVVTLILASFQLRWWVSLEAMLLVLLIGCAIAVRRMTPTPWGKWAIISGVVLAIIPGVIVLTPSSGAAETVNEAEIESLIERDLAHWLTQRTGPDHAAVLASPNLAASLAFHGGLRALGSPYAENRNGLNISLRISGSTSQDEALALVQRHQITHIVLASWDPTLEQLAELGGEQENKSLVTLLHRWLPPRWLKPVPYRMPEIPGFEGQSVVVFEVVELQDNSVALSHLAEYFAETAQPQLAASAAEALGRLFPDDLGATIARVQTAAADGNQRAVNEAFKVLQSQLTEDAVLSLPWDRRVSLAIVLAESKQFDEARKQLEQCLAEIDEPRLRSLTLVGLYRCQQLIKAFGLKFPDDRLQKLSRSLLPPELRSTL
ncbi:MAG: hypothetical protein ABIZ04_15935 [Opitutus sp.]